MDQPKNELSFAHGFKQAERMIASFLGVPRLSSRASFACWPGRNSGVNLSP